MKNSVTFFMMFLCMIYNQFLYLVNVNISMTQITILIIVSFLALLMLRKVKKEEYIFNKMIAFLMFLYVQEIILSYIKYRQTILDIILTSNYLLIIFAYYIFRYYVKTAKDLKKFEFIIVLYTIILSGLFILQYLNFNYNGRVILYNIDIDSLRFDKLRINNRSSDFINLGTILSFSFFINKNNNYLYRMFGMIGTLLGVTDIFLVQQTRILCLIVIVSIIFMILSINRKNFVKNVCYLSIISIILISVSSTALITNYTNSFSTDDGSYTGRAYAINFFMSQVKESPLYGAGFIRVTDEIGDLYYLARGDQGIAYRSDVGIIGFLDTMGIFGLVWYIVLMYKLCKILINLIKNNLISNYSELVGIFTILLLGSGTLIVMDTQRIILLPIILTIFDFAYSDYYGKECSVSNSLYIEEE